MKSISLILCILFTPVNLVFSQEFSLEQLIETAIIRNLTLKIEKENLKQEEIGLTNANRLRWPTLNANASTSNNLSDQSSSVSLRLTQPLYQGGAIADQQSIADFELKKATLAYTRKAQSIIKDVQNAYIDLLLAIAIEQEDRRSLARLREQARISKILFDEGDVWKNDVLQAEVSIAQSQAQISAAENNILRAKSALNILLNNDLGEPLSVKGKLIWFKENWTWEKIKFIVEQSHPEMIMAKIDEDIANFEVEIKRAKHWPTLSLSGSLVRNDYITGGTSSNEDITLTLSANWKLWDAGKINREVSTARILKHKKSIALFNKRQTILQQAQLSWFNYKESERQVNVLRQAIDIAQENYRVNSVRYQEKLGTANDLLIAQTLLSNSKKDWLSALARYTKAVYTLKYNLGQEKI